MAYVWLVMILLLASSVSIDARRKRVRRKCQKIAVPACAGLGYQRTSFPNKFTNITTQAQTNNLTKFLPELFKLNCTTTDALPFLCSVYVPVCAEKKNVLPPCREFCTKSVGRCPALAARFGIPWPQPLDCSNYPKKNSGKVCLPKLKSRKKSVKPKGKKADKKKPKAEGKKCCRLGEFAATAVQKCNLTLLTSAIETAKRPFLKSLKACKAHEAKYNECCLKKLAKIQARTNKKQERKDKKKERKEKKKARKQERVEKKQKKQQKQQKRKQKQEGKQQKKKDRKQKKQNKKQKKIHGRGD